MRALIYMRKSFIKNKTFCLRGGHSYKHQRYFLFNASFVFIKDKSFGDILFFEKIFLRESNSPD